MTKLQSTLNTNEIAAALDNLTSEQRLEYLEKEFQEHVDFYRQVLDRLAMA
jgi:hypothetical protein